MYALNNNLDLKFYLPEISLIILTFLRLPQQQQMINHLNNITYAGPTVERLSNGIDTLNKHKFKKIEIINKIDFNNFIKLIVCFGYSKIMKSKEYKFRNKNSIVELDSVWKTTYLIY